MVRASHSVWIVVSVLSMGCVAPTPEEGPDPAGQAVESNASAAATQPAPEDIQPIWPLQISTSDATVVIYLPQVETFKGDRITRGHRT